MTLKYTIKFLDYWHVGSGLSAGAKLDSSVLKGSDGLPFIGGKTIKGLAREMAELLEDDTFVSCCFGQGAVNMGSSYFSNAALSKEVSAQIVSNHLQDNLYEEVASTKIDANGMAEDGSLREIEVTIPLTLQGEIDDVPSEYTEKMIQAFTMIKRVGLNRNRGLGRCEIIVEVAS
jgi:hypothetical protein